MVRTLSKKKKNGFVSSSSEGVVVFSIRAGLTKRLIWIKFISVNRYES